MIYLFLYADSFRKSALAELEKVGSPRIIGERHNLMIANISSRKIRELNRAKFIYGYFPIVEGYKIDQKKYIPSIKKGFYRLRLDKKELLRLECFDVNCKRGYSAKDIEVAIGKELEGSGYSIDLKSADTLAYCVLMDSKCYWGKINIATHPHGFIDPFRENKEKKVSRAEFKIIEAFREFGIGAPKIAIDIGAAPGGWSLFLAKKGASVIAIDSGRLEYGKIRKEGVGIRIVNDVKHFGIAGSGPRPGSIVHLICRLDKAYPALCGLNADFVGDDINAGGIESADAIMMYSKLMKRGAVLIMTLKCMHKNVGRYMKEVEARLRPRFRIKRWKVLPHNRQEITLFALRK